MTYITLRFRVYFIIIIHIYLRFQLGDYLANVRAANARMPSNTQQRHTASMIAVIDGKLMACDFVVIARNFAILIAVTENIVNNCIGAIVHMSQVRKQFLAIFHIESIEI